MAHPAQRRFLAHVEVVANNLLSDPTVEGIGPHDARRERT